MAKKLETRLGPEETIEAVKRTQAYLLRSRTLQADTNSERSIHLGDRFYDEMKNEYGKPEIFQEPLGKF